MGPTDCDAMNLLLSIIGQRRRAGFDPARFVVVVNTNLRAGSTTVLIPVNARTGGDRTIDWGDGTTTVENGANPTRTYAADGVYTVQMYGGTTTRLGNTGSSPNDGWTQTLIEVVQWGKAIGWTSFETAFRGCQRNVLMPEEIPRAADGYSSSVNNLSQMFLSAAAFNQDIGAWNTGAVTNMSFMFRFTNNFNQNIGGWDTGSVTTMVEMFRGALAFNSNIGGWNTGEVADMSFMFSNASAFNQNIGAWSLRTAGVNMAAMLSSSGMSTENYSRTLIGWANSVSANSNTPASVTLGATGRTYNNTAYVSGQTYNDAVAARAYLVGSPPTWTISDGGQL